MPVGGCGRDASCCCSMAATIVLHAYYSKMQKFTTVLNRLCFGLLSSCHCCPLCKDSKQIWSGLVMLFTPVADAMSCSSPLLQGPPATVAAGGSEVN